MGAISVRRDMLRMRKNNEPKEHHVTSGRNKLVLCVSSKLSQKFYQFSFSTQTASRGRKVTHFHDGGQEAPSQIDCVFFYYTPKIKQTKETERSPEPGQTRQLRFGPQPPPNKRRHVVCSSFSGCYHLDFMLSPKPYTFQKV